MLLGRVDERVKHGITQQLKDIESHTNHDMNSDSKLWFTHVEHIWKAELNNWKPDFRWTDKLEKWTWDNCFFCAQKVSKYKIRITVRSIGQVKLRVSKDIDEEAKVTFSYNFDISSAAKPEIEENFTIPDNPHQKITKRFGKRRVIKLIKDNEQDPDKKVCEIWEWVSDSTNNSEVERIYDKLQQTIRKPYCDDKPLIEKLTNAQPITDESRLEVLPIIYQPAIDTTKNFLRQVHIHKKKDNLFEITLVFNNEQLRQNKIFHGIYEDLRRVIYGRTKDVESFHIVLEDTIPKKFMFEGIYSDDKDIRSDTTHGDKKSWWNFWRVPRRPIKFYYTATRFPKIYVNTSNHALAEHDNNRNLWKWEYVTWGKDLPIGVGTKSREEVDSELRY